MVKNTASNSRAKVTMGEHWYPLLANTKLVNNNRSCCSRERFLKRNLQVSRARLNNSPKRIVSRSLWFSK